MLFLMNDALLNLDAQGSVPPAAPARFRALSLDFVLKLGAELFAEDPLLHRNQPERARRLALLIRSKAPEVNAALFVAPSAACPPDHVAARVAEVSMEVMAALYTRWREGLLDTVSADRDVWKRLAA
jgi:hypothetical protein